MEPDEVRDGEEARDRVGVHVLWEAVLLVALGATAALVAARSPSAFSGDPLRGQLVALSASVLLACAAAASLRVAAPNLAVGAVAVGAGALLGWLTVDRGLSLAAAAGVVAGAAVGAGLLLGLLVSGLRAPGWAVGLGAAALLGAGVTALPGARPLVLVDPPDLLRWAWPLFGGALLVGLVVTRLVETLGTPREPDFVPGTLPPAEPSPYEQRTQQEQPYDQQPYDPFPRYVER